MATIKSLATLIIGLAIALTITIYFNLNVVWAGINGFVTMTIVLWIERKIRTYRSDRKFRREWDEYLQNNR